MGAAASDQEIAVAVTPGARMCYRVGQLIPFRLGLVFANAIKIRPHNHCIAQRNLSGLTFAATASGAAVNTFYEPAPEAAEGLAQLRASVQQAVRGGR